MSMLVILIFIFLKNGQVDVRTSVTAGTVEACNAVIPLYVKLYKKHGFADGPEAKDVKRITGRCESVDDNNNLAMVE